MFALGELDYFIAVLAKDGFYYRGGAVPAPLVWLDRDDVLITHCGANLQVLSGSSNREQLLPEIHCQLPIGSTAPLLSVDFRDRATPTTARKRIVRKVGWQASAYSREMTL